MIWIWAVARDSSFRVHSRLLMYGLGSNKTVAMKRKVISRACKVGFKMGSLAQLEKWLVAQRVLR